MPRAMRMTLGRNKEEWAAKSFYPPREKMGQEWGVGQMRDLIYARWGFDGEQWMWYVASLFETKK